MDAHHSQRGRKMKLCRLDNTQLRFVDALVETLERLPVVQNVSKARLKKPHAVKPLKLHK